MSKKTKKEEIAYGDEVMVTKGFFKGLVGQAVDIDNESTEFASKFGIQMLDETRYKVKFNKDNSKRWIDASNLKVIMKTSKSTNKNETLKQRGLVG